MKVFISFSGDTSREIALALAAWLPRVMQAIKPFCSEDHVAKGARWTHHIPKALEEASVGILCVTPDNQYSPWLNFEAGALSKIVETSCVCPLVFGMSVGNLEWPLGGFQAAAFSEDEMRRLLRVINERAEEGERLEQEILDDAITQYWPRLDRAVSEAMAREKPLGEPPRSDRALLEEVLSLARGMASVMSTAEEAASNPFLRSLSARATLEDSIAAYLRSNPDIDLSNAGYRSFLSPFFATHSLKAIGGDFRLAGGDSKIAKTPAKNPLLADDNPE